MRWRKVGRDELPFDAAHLVVLVRITCQCARGGYMTLPAGRVQGEWVVSPCEHDFEIEYWVKMPPMPRELQGQIL